MTDPKVIPCATREEWLVERSKGIGASEAEVIFGLSKYESPHQLWARKKLELEDPESALSQKPDSDAMEAGRFLEPANASWWAHRHGKRVLTPQEFYGYHQAYAVILEHPDYPWMRATPDRIIFDREDGDRGVLQLKNVDRFLLEDWEDRPPLRVQVQVQQEMIVAGVTWGAIGAVVGGNRRRDADVTLNPAFARRLIQALRTFWMSLQGDQGPPLTDRDLQQVMARFRAEEGAVHQLKAPENAHELAMVNARLKRLDKERKRLIAEIAAEAGTAQVVMVGDREVGRFYNMERESYVVPPKSWHEFRMKRAFAKEAEAALLRLEPPASQGVLTDGK